MSYVIYVATDSKNMGSYNLLCCLWKRLQLLLIVKIWVVTTSISSCLIPRWLLLIVKIWVVTTTKCKELVLAWVATDSKNMGTYNINADNDVWQMLLLIVKIWVVTTDFKW